MEVSDFSDVSDEDDDDEEHSFGSLSELSDISLYSCNSSIGDYSKKFCLAYRQMIENDAEVHDDNHDFTASDDEDDSIDLEREKLKILTFPNHATDYLKTHRELHIGKFNVDDFDLDTWKLRLFGFGIEGKEYFHLIKYVEAFIFDHHKEVICDWLKYRYVSHNPKHNYKKEHEHAIKKVLKKTPGNMTIEKKIFARFEKVREIQQCYTPVSVYKCCSCNREYNNLAINMREQPPVVCNECEATFCSICFPFPNLVPTCASCGIVMCHWCMEIFGVRCDTCYTLLCRGCSEDFAPYKCDNGRASIYGGRFLGCCGYYINHKFLF